jgi:hypothetical protein
MESESGIRLITDPWRHDPIYGNLLWLFPQNNIPFDEYLNQDYIYVSHHHPDHFCPSTLNLFDKSIPVIIRKFDIPLFDFRPELEKIGFKTIIELGHRETCRLAGGLEITLLSIDYGCDSALIVTDGKHTMFNQNDCFLPENDLAWIGKNFKIDLAAIFFMGLGPFPGAFDLTREEKITGVKERVRDCFFRADETLKLINAPIGIPSASDMTWLRQRDFAELCGALPIEFKQYMDNQPNSAEILLMNSGDTYSFTEAPESYEPAFKSKGDLLNHYDIYRNDPQNIKLVKEIEEWESKYTFDQQAFFKSLKDYCEYACTNKVTARNVQEGISVGIRVTGITGPKDGNWEYVIRFYPEKNDVSIKLPEKPLDQTYGLHMTMDLPDNLAAMAVTGANSLEDCNYRWLIRRPGSYSVAEGAFWDFINGFNTFLQSVNRQPEWGLSMKFKQLSVNPSISL